MLKFDLRTVCGLLLLFLLASWPTPVDSQAPSVMAAAPTGVGLERTTPAHPAPAVIVVRVEMTVNNFGPPVRDEQGLEMPNGAVCSLPILSHVKLLARGNIRQQNFFFLEVVAAAPEWERMRTHHERSCPVGTHVTLSDEVVGGLIQAESEWAEMNGVYDKIFRR